MFALLLGSVTTGPSFTRTLMIVVAADTLGRFPSVEGSNLEGEHFKLPSDFNQTGRVLWRAADRFDKRMGPELVRHIDDARSAHRVGG